MGVASKGLLYGVNASAHIGRLDARMQRAATTSSNVMICCGWSAPSTERNAYSASRLPTTSRFGTLARLCSRDLVVDLFSLRRSISARMPALFSFFNYGPRIVIRIRNDCRDDGLNRRQPQRHLAGIMLDQYTDETLIAAEDRAVEHHRAMLVTVLADIGRIEALRQNPVGLDRADLPCDRWRRSGAIPAWA